MWIEWAADMLGLLGVLMIWAVLLPENSDQWRIIPVSYTHLDVYKRQVWRVNCKFET